VGKWRRHADEMAAIESVLAPYVASLGVQTVAPELA